MVVAMRMVARFSEAPKSRMPRNVARMAKSDGIIASSRAVALRKTKRKTRKMSAAVMAKLCARWDEARADLRFQEGLAHHAHSRPGQRACAEPIPRARDPLRQHGVALGIPLPEEDRDVQILQALHVDVAAQSRFREQQLFQIRRAPRELRGVAGELL